MSNEELAEAYELAGAGVPGSCASTSTSGSVRKGDSSAGGGEGSFVGLVFRGLSASLFSGSGGFPFYSHI